MRDLLKDKDRFEALSRNEAIGGTLQYTSAVGLEAIDRSIAAEKENAELRQKLDIALTALQKYEVTGKVLGEVAREAIHTIQGEETKG